MLVAWLMSAKESLSTSSNSNSTSAWKKDTCSSFSPWMERIQSHRQAHYDHGNSPYLYVYCTDVRHAEVYYSTWSWSPAGHSTHTHAHTHTHTRTHTHTLEVSTPLYLSISVPSSTSRHFHSSFQYRAHLGLTVSVHHSPGGTPPSAGSDPDWVAMSTCAHCAFLGRNLEMRPSTDSTARGHQTR